jgi:hypothetical protein
MNIGNMQAEVKSKVFQPGGLGTPVLDLRTELIRVSSRAFGQRKSDYVVLDP